ncbi:hypothetical protein JAAARDRAFT_209213 [Jaapia argillacea MUCL 33604]|uniref:Uncharacterized protein n=1 Tax=Jaapia argillacea MUCL 33604 TaxID=933084 RepID=A0A067PKX5_9AGAM|nr:hypothetical protein JAAARDRAFT_209213 [Jaapia argillacea MUCL 33604]
MPVPIHIQGPPISGSASYFHKTAPTPAKDGSEGSALLQSVRAALQGVGPADSGPLVQSTLYLSKEESQGDEELSWDAQTVILSSGGIIRKRWNFEEENQVVRWACLGWLEQPSSAPSASPTSFPRETDQSTTSTAPPVDSTRHTFGPFARAQHHARGAELGSVVRAVFIFLRSIGKIIVLNGTEYTFAVPFIVRRAWAVFPHGVIIQRVLDPTEVEEAEASGDSPLPTVFSFTNPFSEPAPAGLTIGITGGFHQTAVSLKDEDENSTKPLKSVPATEHIVWMSHRGPGGTDDVLVTVDPDKHSLSVWRYAYIKPKDIPVPLGRSKPRGAAKKSPSTAPLGHRPRSSLAHELASRLDPRHPTAVHQDFADRSSSPEIPELPPLSALPGMPPSLTSATTLASLVPCGQTPWQPPKRSRNESLTRNDLSVTMDRMVLGGRSETDPMLAPIEHGRMKAAYWMERLFVQEIPPNDAAAWRGITASLFDHRWDGATDRALLGICLPESQTLAVFSVTKTEEMTLQAAPFHQRAAISAVPMRITRGNVWDLLLVNPDNSLVVLTHGVRELPILLEVGNLVETPAEAIMDLDRGDRREWDSSQHKKKIVGVRDPVMSSVTLVLDGGSHLRTAIDLVPQDVLTCQSLHVLALTLPAEYSFALHRRFLQIWSSRGLRTSFGTEFDCFAEALSLVFGLTGDLGTGSQSNTWSSLSTSVSHVCFSGDSTLRGLELPPSVPYAPSASTLSRPHELLAPVLNALHTLGEDLRLISHRYACLYHLVPLICRIARVIRPEWADYWKRLYPKATLGWVAPPSNVHHLDDRLPVWPPDMAAILYGRISNPEWNLPWYETHKLGLQFKVQPSFEYGRLEPLAYLRQLTALYVCLSDNKITDSRKRAENAIHLLVRSQMGKEFLRNLPLGIAAPLKEAARTCQLSPPGDWPVAAYQVIGRNDLADGASAASDVLSNDGYKPSKSRPRKSVHTLVTAAAAASRGEVNFVTGVELDMEDFTEIRFGQDRRLDEVARMLCSSGIPTIRLLERPELNEHDQAKEQQHQVARIAEKTLALPYGRAMFTFGSVANVSRETYAIPKIEYSIRLLPQNVVIAPEPGKIPPDCTNWAEFHNGVAAGLRISPSSNNVDSSWIAFNKPADLTPEHAGFLFALGLTGHLRGMLTWHTFAYLTPKHEQTTIGVLLGLAAANAGSADRHITKLLAVHTPPLLPTPEVDLNVTLVTQAAGLSGLGLLYMGTKDRHMAEMCLSQISRKDLVQPDISNEHREAYTLAAALAFGMMMLGKGSDVPADVILRSRLRTLVHGETISSFHRPQARPSFDVNLTSPAATMGLALMYFKTERQDVADILSLPDTTLGLSRIQPSFLLVRTLGRALIMWNSISAKCEWILSLVPTAIRQAMEARAQGKPVDDAIELAYYNILAAGCFAIALKYAGTAREEAYLLIITHYDLFSRLAYTNLPAYDHRIKRSAIRDGLNLISLSLSMIMAGTGEINCLRRLRYAYGMHHVPIRYGTHVATHQSLGLLFLGGGRYTLGTSDAAIACMVTAFFPRYPSVSSDNKCYLQALRHLWVMAVEPRCLIARDVDTKEVVYLPVKIKVKDGLEVGTAQLISPTLIPDLDKLLSIRVDTPRYWPFYLDVANFPRHRESLLRSQTLHVKRRTAFLSYMEDPKGSRSLFVRSGSSTGDAATLDFPQLSDVKMHPASDLNQFISSFSNDIFFLAFADHLCRDLGTTEQEKLFHAYCHACLLDSILQDKPQTLQSHLTLYRYRTMSPSSPFFNLALQDLRFANDFYNKIYERRFSGRSENNARPPLIRENTVSGTLHGLDQQLETIRNHSEFLAILGRYARGEDIHTTISEDMARNLAWYLSRNSVPVSTILVILKGLAHQAHLQCLNMPPPEGTSNTGALERGIKEVLHATGTQMTTSLAAGWSARSLDEIIVAWAAT